jgi:Fungal Zn(2)-Cys(6) binuclear cluster domain
MVEHNGTSTAAIPGAPPSTTRRPTPAAELHGARRTARKIASKACQYCRARKVRCNATQDGIPCTNYRLDDLKCVVRERGRRQTPTGNTQRRQLLVPSCREREEDSDLQKDVQPEDINSREYVSQAIFSFMGLRYFPQLEAAMRKVNFQIASGKGLAASTIPEANNSLPHLIGDWPLLFDASSLKVILPSSFSPGDYSTSSALALGSSDGGSNPLVTEANLYRQSGFVMRPC